MSVQTLNAATSTRLTTVAAVVAQLPSAGTALVNTLIDSASAALATYCHRVWGQETVLETLPGSGSRYLGLARVPVVVAGTVLSGGTVTEDAIAVTDYSVADAAAGSLYRADGWGRTFGRAWGSEAYASGYILPGMADLRYTAAYTAGYVCPSEGGTATVTLPADVQQAAIETVKAWYLAGSADPRVVRKAAGDLSMSYAPFAGGGVQALPPLAQALLRPWRLPAFGPGQ